MKRLLFILSISVISMATANAQELLNNAPTLNGSNAEIKFEKDSHDFGTLKRNEEAVHLFTFKNTGTEPLIISNAEGTCDCTVPEWPKHPIRPGESATIKVKYDTKKAGSFSKSVRIFSNARNASVAEIKITGTVTPDNAPKK